MNKNLLVLLALVIILLGLSLLPGRQPLVNSPVSQGAVGQVDLPIAWNDMGQKMVEAGVVDPVKFAEVHGQAATEGMLLAATTQPVMTEENSREWLNLLWAFGLANKTRLLEEGPMIEYGETSNFASTGGWTLAQGEAMDHYSHHRLVPLSAEQEALVERVAKNIFRPCCGNATHFPDCNHGMAMLGLLELLAVRDVSEEEMYRVALGVNRLWFPDNYAVIGEYLGGRGLTWEDVAPKEILGAGYSSGAGFQRILAEVSPPTSGGGASCGV